MVRLSKGFIQQQLYHSDISKMTQILVSINYIVVVRGWQKCQFLSLPLEVRGNQIRKT
jgi:hypothetical protein